MFPVLLALLLTPSLMLAAEPVLTPNHIKVKVNEEFYLQLDDAPASTEVDWTTSGKLKIKTKSNKGATIIALQPGYGSVTAGFGGLSLQTSVSVERFVGTVGGKDERRDAAQPRDPALKALLERYREHLKSLGLHDQFTRQSPAVEKQAPALDGREADVRQLSVEFLRELSARGYTLWDLQQFRDRFMAASDGGTPLFPGTNTWDAEFLGTERALMFGRTELFDQVFRETLLETWRQDPQACIFSDILIGSSGGHELKGLSFPSDLDRSIVALDPNLNVATRNRFEARLGNLVNLTMVGADAVLTAHGQATTDVFVGHWGRTFAELDMLKRSYWSLIEPVMDAEGNVVDIRSARKSGSQLFWEVALRHHELAVRTGLDRGPEVEFPKMDLTKEPMLSMEMLRHGIHDVENGPYSRGQQIIKILKYVERSYFMNKKAVAEYHWNPFENNAPGLAQLATEVTKQKTDPVLVERLITEYVGAPITEQNIDSITAEIIAKSKTAMGDNAVRSMAFRLNAVGGIDDVDERQTALDRLWQDLGEEIRAYDDTNVDTPETLTQAHDIVRQVMDGTLLPSELQARSRALHDLLNSAYQLPDPIIERILPVDYFRKISLYLKDRLGWVPDKINKFVGLARETFPNGAALYDAMQEFNKKCAETTEGSLLLKATDFADNALTVYESYLAAKDETEALKNATMALGEIALQDRLPSLQIPIALYKSVSAGDPKPIGMAIAFRIFPAAGQIYTTTQLLERADTWTLDAAFYDQLNGMLDSTDFNEEHKIVSFKLRQAIGAAVMDEAVVSPPGDRKRIVAIFTDPESPFYVSTVFRYWRSLVPTNQDQFGLYKKKLAALRRFFPTHDSVRDATLTLEGYYMNPPKDKYKALREQRVAEMEQALGNLVYVAMADSLEAAVGADTEREKWKKELERLEFELSAGDAHLGPKKGLSAKAAWEIWQQSSRITGENPYVVAPIYKKYVETYQAIERTRKSVLYEIWEAEFDIDRNAGLSSPMKLFLLGSAQAAPRLSGDPDADFALTQAVFKAHMGFATKVKSDLQQALGHPVDREKDKPHLRALGQLGFEMEHLRDDCAERKATNCSPEILAAYTQRRKAYDTYLDKLRRFEAKIRGASTAAVGEPVPLQVVVDTANDDLFSELIYRWSASPEALVTTRLKENLVLDSAADGTEIALYRSDKAVFTASQAGTYTVAVEVLHSGRPGTPTVAKATHIISVLGDEEAPDQDQAPPATDDDGENQDKTADAAAAAAGLATGTEGTVGGDETQTKPVAATGKSSIQAPAKVTAGQIFTVSVEPAPELKGKVEHYNWSGPVNRPPLTAADLGKQQYDPPTMKMLVHPKDAFPHEANIKNGKKAYVSVDLLDAAGVELDESAIEIPVQLVRLGVALPEGWKGGPHVTGFGAEIGVQEGDSGWQSYSARFYLHWMSGGDSVPEGYDEALSIGEFKGRGKSEPLKYTAGSWGSGYVGCSATQSLSAVVEKDGMRLEVAVTGGTSGFWDCRNQDWVMSKGAAIFREALALANAAARLTPDGSKLPVIDVSRFAVKVTPTPEPPETLKKAGPFEVIGVPVKPFYASTASISVQNKGQDLGPWKVLWQASEPGIEFEPPEGVSTVVTFGRMGEVAIWAQVLDAKSGNSVGDDRQVQATVIAPKFSLRLTPDKPRVGQEIRGQISSEPSIAADRVEYKWTSPASSNRMEYNDPAAEIGFALIDVLPLALLAEARVPYYGDAIGSIEGNIQAQQYALKVTATKQGPPALIWDPKRGGLVPAGTDVFYTGERIQLTAVLEGEPKPGDVRWNWKTNEGVTISSPDGSAPAVSRSVAGRITAEVTAHDRQRVELGKGSISISVSEPATAPGGSSPGKTVQPTDSVATVSQAEIKAGQQKSSAAAGKFTEAKEASRLGKYDQAISSAEQALAADPGNQEISGFVDQVKSEKQKADKGLAKVDQLIKASDFRAAKDVLASVKNQSPHYPPAQAMDKKLTDAWQDHINKVKAAFGDIQIKSERRDFKEALDAIEQTRDSFRLSPGELQTLSEKEAWCQEMEGKKEQARALFNTAKEKLAAYDYDGSIKDFQAGHEVSSNLWNINTDSTHAEAEKVNAEALSKKKALDEHLEAIQWALGLDPYKGRIKDFENALTRCAEARVLQPGNAKLPEYEVALKDKLQQANSADVQDQNHVPGEAGSQAAARPDLSGVWYGYDPRTGNKGNPQQISQSGDKLTFLNEFNQSSDGRFIDQKTIIATDWEGGLQGSLADGNQRIVFSNGSVWQKVDRLTTTTPSKPSEASVTVPKAAGSSPDQSTVANAPANQVVAGSSVLGNTEEVITITGINITAVNKIRLLITEASGLTASGQRPDSARIGEVEFYDNGRRIVPSSVTAESVFPGYSAQQAMDGNRQYRYLSEGALGWASGEKGSQSPTWIEFSFEGPVNVDKVVVTTAPSNPYRLHSFELRAIAASGQSAGLQQQNRDSGQAVAANDETALDERRYKVVAIAGITWSQAQQQAEDMGGHLAVVTSQAELEFVFGLAKKNPDVWYPAYGHQFGPWLGASQVAAGPEPAGGWN